MYNIVENLAKLYFEKFKLHTVVGVLKGYFEGFSSLFIHFVHILDYLLNNDETTLSVFNSFQ